MLWKRADYHIYAIGGISITKSVKEPIGIGYELFIKTENSSGSWPRFVENVRRLPAMCEM